MSSIPAHEEYEESARSAWAFTGAAFGAVMLITVGIFQILEGIAAILRDKIYVSGPNYAFAFNVRTWGWIHLILGVIALVVAIGVLRGAVWGLIAGVTIAGLSALANFAFLPYYPFWSLIILAFNVFIIWSLCSLVGNRTNI